MHYYQFNIGDYRRDTPHLSRLEHSIYRDLIDSYYLDEKPIPLETQSVTRRLRLVSDEEATALKNVLSDFFVQKEDGWHHSRIESDIANYYAAKANHWATRLSRVERCAIQARRNASKKNATPKWLSKDQISEMAAKYADAALMMEQTGIAHEVDHIVPLRGKSVSGLHVPWNLEVITAHKNRIKSNSFGGC